MDCPHCSGTTAVTDSRKTPDGLPRRRRTCRKCGESFSTLEVTAIPDLHAQGTPLILATTACSRADCAANAAILRVLASLLPRNAELL